MHDFKYKKNELFCENTRISTIAQQVGTPFYLYSYKTLIDHLTKIKKAFVEIDPLICFAVKSNGNMAVIKALANKGAGCDIVSGGELKKALKLKVSPKKIVFASVGKKEEAIALAIKSGILLFNVESVPELEVINAFAKKADKKVQVAIRINPDVEAATHHFITTGTLKNKFGIDLQSTRDLLRRQKAYSHIEINGLHIHIGSQIVNSTPFINAIKKVVGFVNDLRQEGIEIKYFDIGGGLGIIYKDEKPQTAEDFAQNIIPYLKKTGLKIIMEPGRFIAGNAGIFVTKVLYLKDNGFKKFLIVDGGMNDLIRPSLYNAYHDILPVKKTSSKKITVDVVGPVCESGDYFGKERALPKMVRGDLLAVMSAGAYGYVMSSNYNARPRVAEVMVKGNKFAIINEREKFNELIKRERIPDFLK
ncbi:MAG: diaminopimelate decarboxylase [Candidatus Omnitrophica bacterium]|nr:diaminopimelate decarboxylase [Candidatus Omnitrophota bacterium]